MALTRRPVTVKAGGVDLGPLPDLTGYALRRAQIAVFQDFYACFAALDLRPAEFSVLLVLRHNPGVRQRPIADALKIKPPNFAVLLARLTQRGLVERQANGGAGRAMALHLTQAGEALLDQAMPVLRQHETYATGRLGEAERQELLRLLHALV